MAPIFPPTPPTNMTHMVGDKQFVWDGAKWELTALSDTYTNQLPVVLDEVDERGVGRTVDHSFTIKQLDKHEQII